MKTKFIIITLASIFTFIVQHSQAQTYRQVAHIITTRVPAYQVQGAPVNVILRLAGSFQLGAPNIAYLQPGAMWTTQASPLYFDGNEASLPEWTGNTLNVNWLTDNSFLVPGSIDPTPLNLPLADLDQLTNDPYPYQNYTDGIFNFGIFLNNWYWDYYRADGRWLVLIADYGEDCEILVLYDFQ